MENKIERNVEYKTENTEDDPENKNDQVEVQSEMDPNNLNENGSTFYDNNYKNKAPQFKPSNSNSNQNNEDA